MHAHSMFSRWMGIGRSSAAAGRALSRGDRTSRRVKASPATMSGAKRISTASHSTGLVACNERAPRMPMPRRPATSTAQAPQQRASVGGGSSCRLSSFSASISEAADVSLATKSALRDAFGRRRVLACDPAREPVLDECRQPQRPALCRALRRGLVGLPVSQHLRYEHRRRQGDARDIGDEVPNGAISRKAAANSIPAARVRAAPGYGRSARRRVRSVRSPPSRWPEDLDHAALHQQRRLGDEGDRHQIGGNTDSRGLDHRAHRDWRAQGLMPPRRRARSAA